MGIYLADMKTDNAMLVEFCRRGAVNRAKPMRFLGNNELASITRRGADAYGTFAATISIISWQQQFLIGHS